MANVKYSAGSTRVKQLVERVREEHHEDLADARVEVVEATKLKDAVKVVAAGPGERARGVDLVLVYSCAVLDLEDPVLAAVIDNALEAWEGVEKKGRNGASVRKAYQRRPPSKVYLDVLERQGGATVEWKTLLERCKAVQMDLFKAAANGGTTPRRRRGPVDLSTPSSTDATH